MRGRLLRFALVAALAGGLAACGSSDPKPELGAAPEGAVVPGKGYYKVGSPYRINGVWYRPSVAYDYDETGIASWYGPGFHGKQTANGEVFDQYDLTAAHPTLPMPSLVRVTNLENGKTIELRVNDRGPFKNGRILDVSRRGAELLGFLADGTARVRVQVLERESRQLAALAQGGQIARRPPGKVEGEVAQVTAAPLETVAAEPLAAPASTRSQGGQTRQTAGRRGAADYPVPSGEVRQVAVADSSLFIQAGAFSDQGNALNLAQRLTPFGQPQVAQTQVDGRRFWRVRLGPLRDVAEADAVLAALIDGGFSQSRVVVD